MLFQAIIPANMRAEASDGVETREITTNILADKNTTFEGADDKGVPYWWYGSSADLSQSEDAQEGNFSMKIEPTATGSYAGGASNVTDDLEKGTTYEYSYYAKLDSKEVGQASLVLNYMYGEGYDDTVQVLASTDEDTYSFSADEWTRVTGTFTFEPNEEKEFREIHLTFSAVDSQTVFSVDDFKVGILDGAETATGENILYDSQFNDESSAWDASGDAELSRGTNREEEQETLGAGYGYIIKRTQNWECIVQDISDRVKNNTDYKFSFYAKLSEEYGEQERTVQLCTTKKDSTDTDELYDQLNTTEGKAQVTANEWTKVEGTLSVVWSGELKKLEFKISEQGDPLEDGTYGSYYVANVSLEEIEKSEKKIQHDIKDLKAQLKEDYGGMAGVAIPAMALNDEARMELVTKHFNSVTAENEMKPESFLGTNPNIGDDGFPILDFTNGNKMMDYIKNYNENNPDNIIKVRGHVLVWHSQTPGWFFREGYDTNKSYVDKATMSKRLENYIKQVLEYYHGEGSEYDGIIYSWDVVNEAINDVDGEVRAESDWYRVYEDNSFIKEAFVYANKYVPEDVTLFYNDYNDTNGVKVQGICRLIEQIKATSGARIDGMGMQGHYDMSSPTEGQFKEAAEAYAKALGEGGELQLTELDFKASKDYNGTNNAVEYQKQAYRYKTIYDAILSLEKEGKANFNTITFWGTHDGVSWLQDSNVVGGAADGDKPQCPLLFDDNYQAKPAYWAFVDASKLEPFINEEVAIEADDFDTDLSKEYSFTTGDAQVTFTPIWNSDGLQVQVYVEDSTIDESDAVTVYVDTSDNIQKFVLTRGQSTSTSDGYLAEFDIPINNLEIMSKVGFDIKLTDGEFSGSWNDLTNNQDNSSKYYGTIIMKPAMSIEKGTIEVDGAIEERWSDVEEVPFTIAADSPEATASAKFLWDDDYLYALINVVDSDLDKVSSQAHEHDSVEVFIDENNNKSDSYEDDDKQYRINYDNEQSFNGPNANEENLISEAILTGDGYMVEVAFKWTDIEPTVSTQIGLEAQINDASGGSRIGTYSWYDETGTGWSSPSVFGSAVLVDCKHENLELRNNVEATCTRDGYSGDVYCKDCDTKLSSGSVIEALGHNYVASITKEASVAEEGVRTYTCTNCGDTYTEVIPKLTSDANEDVTKDTKDTPEKDEVKETSKEGTAAKTGDEGMIWVYVAIFALISVVLIVELGELYMVKKKKKKNR